MKIIADDIDKYKDKISMKIETIPIIVSDFEQKFAVKLQKSAEEERALTNNKLQKWYDEIQQKIDNNRNKLKEETLLNSYTT